MQIKEKETATMSVTVADKPAEPEIHWYMNGPRVVDKKEGHHTLLIPNQQKEDNQQQQIQSSKPDKSSLQPILAIFFKYF